MSNKPSEKWLNLSLAAVLLLIVAGIFFTAASYRSTQKNALKRGQEQLVKVNDYATKILSLEIKSHANALATFAVDDFPDGAPLTFADPEKVRQALFSDDCPLEGIYLFDPNGNALAGLEEQNTMLSSQTVPPKSIQRDRYFDKALAGKVLQNGAEYFADDSSYINLYQPIKTENGVLRGLLVVPLDLQQLFRQEINGKNNDLHGYTMVKNAAMKVVIHPENEQLDLSIVEDRKKKYPELDYRDLEKVEHAQASRKEGVMSYNSYWWTSPERKQVLKISAFRWITIGKAHWVVASTADFNERSGIILQDLLINLGILAILLAVLLLTIINFRNYSKKNQAFLENQRLLERQKIQEEKHDLEKQMLQESKLETIGLLTTSIVHDMNNFLTPLLGNLQLLIDEHQGDPELVADLTEVYEAAQRGQKLSGNVLRFSKASAGKKETLTVEDVVAEAVETMKLLTPKSVHLAFEPHSAGTAAFEKEDLLVILYNLITNAYQAADKVAEITVTIAKASPELRKKFRKHSFVYRNKDFAMIQVQDNGPGIPKAIEKKIFTPFFTTRSENGGTGLGLFTVASIIKKNDWLLQLDSSKDGTTFTIVIPLSR